MRSRWLTPRPAPYLPVWQAMQAFTGERHADTPDELWLTEHLPVYTLGQAGRREHLLNPGGIPVVPTDRGGQVTYHGPGQVVVYPLFDLKRAGYFVREYVHRLEAAVIATLQQLGLPEARRKDGAPGVYVPMPDANGDLAKIAALGIKVRNGCAYHGAALNVDMDLRPFLDINPCGYEGLRTTDLAEQGIATTVRQAGDELARLLAMRLAAAASCSK